MADLPTPEEHTPAFTEARAAMSADAETIVAMLLKELSTRSAHYDPADNENFEHADQFLLDTVLERLAERR